MVQSTSLLLVLAFAAVSINGAPFDRRHKDEQSQDESKVPPFGGSAQNPTYQLAPDQDSMYGHNISQGFDPDILANALGIDPASIYRS
ncbi:hypothetical protein [Absidia glauca]|uniref:Uncharacterized protein n=1 Tax=Absidia glauca TaxID=4829 RepID=A0A163JTJ5_ABSGL|nr:hypothetical protein [Absidia glauca]